jgi:geranylgeranyl transferase type-1 subunit beta
MTTTSGIRTPLTWTCNSTEPTLNKPKQITYWLRCLKTFLPSPYEGNDSNRVSLAFFILTSLDLLSAVDSHVTPEERQGYIDWIYYCQHPSGGFRGSPSTDLGPETNSENEHWNSASVPSTYFSLAALLILGDDLDRVKREECLRWLPRLQRENGCFGEILVGNEIEGGTDTRLCLFAAGTRWILRRRYWRDLERNLPDIRLDALRQYIYSCEV